MEVRSSVWPSAGASTTASVAILPPAPSAVLDDKWLAKPVGQPLSEQRRKDVGRTTRCKADNDAHRPRRIGLRPREARPGRERGGACSQMEKSTAGKFHFEPPFTSFDHLTPRPHRQAA